MRIGEFEREKIIVTIVNFPKQKFISIKILQHKGSIPVWLKAIYLSNIQHNVASKYLISTDCVCAEKTKWYLFSIQSVLQRNNISERKKKHRKSQ